jgi:hypothetical protein
MDATPFEQVVAVAAATYGTGELTVSPFVGLLTVTLAKAGAANIKSDRTTEWKVFMTLPSAIDFEHAYSGRPVFLSIHAAGDDWVRGGGKQQPQYRTSA